MSKLTSGSIGLVVLAALVGGATGAGAMWAVARRVDDGVASKRASEAEGLPAASDADDEDDEDDSAGRLARLESEVRALRQRNTSSEALQKYAKALNKGKAGEPGAADAGPGGAGDELAPVMDAEDPSFELAVRTVLDRVDWERAEERRVTQSKRREERAQRQTELLAERLKLNPSQQQSVQSLLTEQMEAFRKLREGSDETQRPSTRSEWRTRVEAIRTETERKLGEVLDDEQMSSYRTFVEEEGFGARGGRAGGARGPAGRQR